MTAQLALGNNNAGALADVSPQPAMSGLEYLRLTFGADDSVNRDGKPITHWTYGFLTPAQFTALLAALGVSETVKSAAVTVRTLTNDFTTFANYNARAIMPEVNTDYRYYGGLFLDVTITFRGLEAL